ncbi:hypothetical protein DQ238_11315 [Geodermatophilus sp. TF02-6]|uniref:RES domain-containing protein n=1 Tax=Geodermatophilus sp. TF02-6 TaxID=2250575 RepID=UPI000DE8EDDD|nr:RES domain-containing protein [Geodermatophilus sp. TF02-6]RBY78959.1 hypothetical protein DQ238_11315 [Geodermatophilus sp. TF02-6]
MPATEPPDDLAGFPRTALDPGATLFRLVLARDPVTGTPRAPWFFSSLPSDHPGRFDLPAPDGSCCFSDRRYGAWLEVFRSTGLVDRVDVEKRRLLTATRTAPPLPVADLRAPQARSFGVTDDLFAGDDHTLPQAWASGLHRAQFAGLASTARHDPTAVARTVTLFGRSGPRTRVRGWHTAASRPTGDTALLQELAPFGTGVLSRPYDVPVTSLPG